MNKEPQDIVKFSSRSADGHYLQMTFDGTNMSLFAMMLRFENFLRGMGYVIQEDDYDAAPDVEGEEFPEQTVTGRLENWNRTASIGGHTFLIWGDIYDDVHKRWIDGTRIHTSGIRESEVKEGDIVETLNSTYLLGKERSYEWYLDNISDEEYKDNGGII